jgi:hypothetical protein
MYAYEIIRKGKQKHAKVGEETNILQVLLISQENDDQQV